MMTTPWFLFVAPPPGPCAKCERNNYSIIFMPMHDVGPTLGRGRYDRALNRAERSLRQRERLLSATRRALAELPLSGVTVTRIAELSRSGRNTFYEHFESAESIVSEVLVQSMGTILDALDLATADARTPVERVRALAGAWIDAVGDQGRLGVVAVEHAEATEAQRLDRVVRRVVDDARAAGVLGQAIDDLRASAALGAMKGVVRTLQAHPAQRARATETLADVLLRIFR